MAADGVRAGAPAAERRLLRRLRPRRRGLRAQEARVEDHRAGRAPGWVWGGEERPGGFFLHSIIWELPFAYKIYITRHVLFFWLSSFALLVRHIAGFSGGHNVG